MRTKKLLKYLQPCIAEAEAYAKLCREGKRWHGNTVLIIVDAALDSIGISYFTLVEPRTQLFYKTFVQTGKIKSLKDLAVSQPENFHAILANKRLWKAAVEIAKTFVQIKKENNISSDFEAMKFWAQSANPHKVKEDIIGKIHGVGLVTFQYLRMQAGVDCTMPDKIIQKVVERELGIKIKGNFDLMEKMQQLSAETGLSETALCWAIWLRESDYKANSVLASSAY